MKQHSLNSRKQFPITNQGESPISCSRDNGLFYRWAVFDLDITKADGSKAKKIIFYCFVPDTYVGMDKLFFSAAKDPILKHFEGVARSIQVSNMSVMRIGQRQG